MKVRKSDNTLEDYSEVKIAEGVRNAYKTAHDGLPCPVFFPEVVLKRMRVYDNISTFEIRKQIEGILLETDKDSAHAYIQTYEATTAKQVAVARKKDFIDQYIKASNAATGSKFDANANVEQKNIVTMGNELHKYDNIQQNRQMLYERIEKMYGRDLAKQYIKDLESHILYKHDETAIPGMPYCVAISMYPFLEDGLTGIGGISRRPTDLRSFCGEFINLVFSVASQFAGAVATPEFLMYLDYFIRKDYGDAYLLRLNEVVDNTVKQRTLEKVIENAFQQVVHSMNMPSGNRGYQTVFWNIGYFDKPYFDGVFGKFTFPDGSAPVWETLSWLQKKFMKWFNEERTKYTLTFPVETMAMLTDGNDIVDKEYADFTAGMWAEGHSFFCYLSDSADSLSSCCRLRNSLKDLEDQDADHNYNTHQFSMGTASVATGSKSVMTINLNRVIQDAVMKRFYVKRGKVAKIPFGMDNASLRACIAEAIEDITTRVQKYQAAFNSIVKSFYEANMLPVYSAGFITMNKQYLTIGVNGLTDAAEYLGITASPNEPYHIFVNLVLETINKCNRSAKTRELMYNTEFVPGENLSVKNYGWDAADGYYVSPHREMYSSYFFNPEDKELSVLDKMELHGQRFVQYLDGGSACHINLQEHLTKEQYRTLLKIAAEEGTNYFTFNVKNTVCNDCGYISKHTLDKCPHCGSTNLDYMTRIIGYLKRVSAFSEPRQREEAIRSYNK